MQHLCCQGQAHRDAFSQARLITRAACRSGLGTDAHALRVRSGTILPGITRKSIIELARQRGYEVEERAVTVQEAVGADELFCTVRGVAVRRWAASGT